MIDLALQSCDKEYAIKTEDEKSYVIEAIQILYNMAAFDRVRFYIPGETANMSQRRKKFASFGGFTIIYYLSKCSEYEDIRKLFETLKVKEIQIADLTLTLESLKEYLNKKAETNEESYFPE